MSVRRLATCLAAGLAVAVWITTGLAPSPARLAVTTAVATMVLLGAVALYRAETEGEP